MRKIEIVEYPTMYIAKQFWYKWGKVDGIAEWKDASPDVDNLPPVDSKEYDMYNGYSGYDEWDE